MTATEGYREFIERVESSVEYKVDVAALRFVDEVSRCMRQRGVNQAELARRLEKSQAYISKLMRGDSDANFTLATMVKLAEALGEELHLHLAAPGSVVHWRDVIATEVVQTAWPEPKQKRPVPVDLVTSEVSDGEAPVAA